MHTGSRVAFICTNFVSFKNRNYVTIGPVIVSPLPRSNDGAHKTQLYIHDHANHCVFRIYFVYYFSFYLTNL